jgi:polysaccharide biosynthesis protein PelE
MRKVVLAPVAITMAITALVFEALAIVFVANIPQGSWEVVSFLLFHLAASVLFALVVHTVLPDKYREPRLPALALLAAFAFFIPIFGLLALATGVVTVLAVPRGALVLPFALVRQPEFAVPLRDQSARMRATGLRTLLLDPTLSAELRLRSLMALQNIPIRRAGPMLRRLLGDPSDDMRLTAYGLLERESKRIAQAIQDELATLPTLTEPAPRLASLRRVAEQYWELVYTGLAQADLSEFAIKEGLRYCEAAMQIAPREPGLWMLRGRLLNAKGDDAGALESYRTAAASGLPAERLAPYVAEIAFERREYAEVRKQLGALDASNVPTMAAVVSFWSRPAARAAQPAAPGAGA